MSHRDFAKFLFTYLRPYLWQYIIILLSMIYTGIHISLEPYLLKMIIDKVQNYNGPRDALFYSTLPNIMIFVGASIFYSGCWQIKHILERAIIPYIETNMVMRLFEHLQMHSHRYFQDQMVGNLSNKIADLHAGVDRILGITTHFLRMFMGITITTILMYTVHITFATLLLTWSIIFICVSYFLMTKIETYSIKRADTRSRAFGGIVDTISNIMTTRLFSRQDYELKRQSEFFKNYINHDRLLRRQQIITWVFLGGFATILLAGMVMLLVYGAQKGFVVVGDFAFIMLTSVTIIENMFFLMELISEFTQRLGTAKQGAMLIQRPHEIQDKKGAKPLEVKRGTVEFKNVAFGYVSQPFLHDLSVKIFGGQKVGLVGYSGGGKTTFINLICRLFDIKEGAIRIDDQDIRDVTQKSLREAISYIPQDPILFHRTIRDNIAYGDLNATDEDIQEAAKRAHAHNFIMRFPEGYNTKVGERGLKLSGGQRQRIAIARSFLKNAPILIMDEATSALDSKTEKLIQDSVEKLMEGKTVFVIAHRLSTLLSMDRILVLERGCIIEDGDHYTLLENKRLYNELWSSQSRGMIGTKRRKKN